MTVKMDIKELLMAPVFQKCIVLQTQTKYGIKILNNVIVKKITIDIRMVFASNVLTLHIGILEYVSVCVKLDIFGQIL